MTGLLQKLSALTMRQLLLLTGLLFLPALFSGLHSDDLLHYVLVNGHPNLHPKNDISLFGLFSFVTDDATHRAALMNFGILPWATKAEFTWQFWRPVTELSHYLDYRFLTDLPWLMHAHSIALFLLGMVLLYRLFALLGMEKNLSGLAIALFALNCSHAITVAWLCNRSSLLAFVFGLLTWILHIKTLPTANARHTLACYCLSCTTLACTLLSGEIGLSIGGFLLGYALFMDRRGCIKGMLAILPYLLVVLIWAYIHNTNNMGVKGSSWGYIDPKLYPAFFLEAFKSRYPLIILSQLTALPVDVFSLLHSMQQNLAINTGYLVLAGLCAGLLVKHPYRNIYGLFLTGMLVSALPTTVNPPEARNMIFVSLGSAVIMAMLLLALMNILTTTPSKAVKYCTYPLFALLIASHLFFSALLIPLGSWIPKLLAEYNNILAQSLTVKATDKLVLFGMDNSSYLVPQMAFNRQTLPAAVWNISQYRDNFTSKKVSDHELLLSSNDGFYSANGQVWLQRNQFADFSRTTNFPLDGLTITILSTNAEGFPTSMKLVFAETLDHYTFLKLKGNGFEKLDMNKELIFGP